MPIKYCETYFHVLVSDWETDIFYVGPTFVYISKVHVCQLNIKFELENFRKQCICISFYHVFIIYPFENVICWVFCFCSDIVLIF